jgi:hypothetical protein
MSDTPHRRIGELQHLEPAELTDQEQVRAFVADVNDLQRLVTRLRQRWTLLATNVANDARYPSPEQRREVLTGVCELADWDECARALVALHDEVR